MKYETLVDELKAIIKKAIVLNYNFRNEVVLKPDFSPDIDRIKNDKFGDYCTKFLFHLQISQESIKIYGDYLVKKLSKMKTVFKKIEFIFPGFLNLTVTHEFLDKYLNEVTEKKNKYGVFKKSKLFYNLEFVSANPTGNLHLGHARNAAYGDTLVNIWKTSGISVNKEFYINDGGNQIDKLAESVYVRYLQQFNIKMELPEDGYHGNEIIGIAKQIVKLHDKKYVGKHKLSKNEMEYFKTFSTNVMLDNIKKTLAEFGVKFDIWFHESEIYKKNLIPSILLELKKYLYEQDGATFLKTTEFGDDKDRVLIKSDGSYTYFTPDIAYHNIKLLRGYDKIFNIWGSDHASYVNRVKIALQMLGYPADILTVKFQQMIKLVKDGQEFKMSKRTGNSLTLKDMLDTIGKDAARWYLVSTSLDSHLDIDVDKVTKQDSNNPIFYVQYAHARINQLLEKNKDSVTFDKSLNLLISPIEKELKNLIVNYKHLIKQISSNYEVHWMCAYLQNLAKTFHSFYSNNKIVDKNSPEISGQRYLLSSIVKQVLGNGLKLLGIEPIEKMERETVLI